MNPQLKKVLEYIKNKYAGHAMAGGLLMIPVTRLRRTLPRYTAIYGMKHGFFICDLTTFFSMLARAMVLAWVILYFYP